MNAVGVDVNTASAPLLRRVSGIGEGLAENIVAYRDAKGPFRSVGRSQTFRGSAPRRSSSVRASCASPPATIPPTP